MIVSLKQIQTSQFVIQQAQTDVITATSFIEKASKPYGVRNGWYQMYLATSFLKLCWNKEMKTK